MASMLPRFSLCALLCAALLATWPPRPVAALAQATTVTTNETTTLNGTEVNLCSGEVVVLTGEIHVVTHTTTDSNGGLHVKTHQNFENVTGTGTLFLTPYRAVSSNNHSFNDNGSNAQQEFTTVNRVRLISPGPAENFLLNATSHTTVNANGEVTTTFSNFVVNCTG